MHPHLRSTLLLVLALFGASCSYKAAKEAEQKADSLLATNATDSLKRHFVPLLNGTWVLTDYLQAIEQTRSPLQASDKLQGVVGMRIEASPAADSIAVGASWNNHEGLEFGVYFRPGKVPNSLQTNLPDYDDPEYDPNNKDLYYEIGYETNKGNTTLLLYQYHHTGKRITKHHFTKVLDKQSDPDLGFGLQYSVNERLLTGAYLVRDSLGNSSKIFLKSDGSIVGFSAFKKYRISTDFMGGPHADFDEIGLSPDNEYNYQWFALVLRDNNILLHSTIGDPEKGETVQLGKLRYTLVRE